MDARTPGALGFTASPDVGLTSIDHNNTRLGGEVSSIPDHAGKIFSSPVSGLDSPEPQN